MEKIMHKPRSDPPSPEKLLVVRLPTSSPSNFEGTPGSAPCCHQYLLPTSGNVAPEAKHGKKRRRLDDTEEEGQRKRKSRTIIADAICQSPLSGLRQTMVGAATTQEKKRRRSDAEEAEKEEEEVGEERESQPKNKKSRTIAAGPNRSRRSARLRRGAG